MSQTIEVIVKPDGTTRVETRGFSGVVCRDASQFLEVALGRQMTETFTAEYYQQATNSPVILQNQSTSS